MPEYPSRAHHRTVALLGEAQEAPVLWADPFLLFPSFLVDPGSLIPVGRVLGSFVGRWVGTRSRWLNHRFSSPQ